jgi:putative membrane protein
MNPTGNIKIGSHSIHYNWRLILVRILVNTAALMLTVLVLPNISVTYNYGTFLILGTAMAILNAVVKPALQVLTLPLIFVSYGLVVVAINGVILLLLGWLFPERIDVSTLFVAFIGGAVIGVITIFLENLFGLTPPIVDDQAAEAAEAIGGQ